MTENVTEGDQPARSPRVLIATARNWVSTARLAVAIQSFGCQVDLLAPKTHPAYVTQAIHTAFTYNPLRPLGMLEQALRESEPDAIIPVDELTLHHLEELAERKDAFGEHVRELLDRSLGGVAVLRMASSRMDLIEIAHELGIPTPRTIPVDNEQDIPGVVETLGLPLVLKADSSSGGQGVRIVYTVRQARQAWRSLHRAPDLLRAVKRGVVSREWTHVRLWARRDERRVVAQQFITGGGELTGMVVAYRGRLLSAVSLDVVQIIAERRPSSVVRVVHDPVMESIMRRLVAGLGISGFCGFDFVVDPATGELLLIEMNSRPTQLVHLPLGPGLDLVAAFLRGVLQLEVPDRPAATEKDTIALFPHEVFRDAASTWLETAFHDVPWNAPELVEHTLLRSGGHIRPGDLGQQR